jgi:uncharacterized membrane protein
MTHFRRYFTAGLLVWAPLGITVLIIKFVVDLLDSTLVLLPSFWQPDTLFGFHVPGLGILLALAIVTLTGVIAANLLGQQLLNVGERMLGRIPFVRSVYSGVKQLFETVFSGKGESFRKVVLIEYPRKGLWTVAFLTSEGQGVAQRSTGQDVVNIFVPTTPNPTGGFFLMVPRKDVIELDMSVDDGLKMILSVGVVVPGIKKAPVVEPIPLQLP